MAHLTHKLPWSMLATAVRGEPEWRFRHPEEREALDRKAAHFAGVLSSTIEEFAATDKRSDEEKAAYDVSQWPSGFTEPHALYGAGAHMGFTTSVVGTYLTLNLLVADEARMRPVLCETTSFLNTAAGRHDGSHPEKFEAQLLRLLHLRTDHRWHHYGLRELTPEILDGTRSYCAELFRVMYTRPDAFTRECIQWVLEYVVNALFRNVGRPLTA